MCRHDLTGKPYRSFTLDEASSEYAVQSGGHDAYLDRHRVITAMLQSSEAQAHGAAQEGPPRAVAVEPLFSLMAHASEFIRIGALRKLKARVCELADADSLSCSLFADGIENLIACARRLAVCEESGTAFKILACLATTTRDAHLLLAWNVPEACLAAMVGRCNQRTLQHVCTCVSVLSRGFYNSFAFASSPHLLTEVADVCPQAAAHIALTTPRGMEALVLSGKLSLVLLNTRDDTLACELADACVGTPGGCNAVRGAVRKLLGADTEQSLAALSTLVWNDTELAMYVVANHEVALIEAVGRAITRGNVETSVALLDLLQALLEMGNYASPLVANFCAAWLRMMPAESDLIDTIYRYLEGVVEHPECARATMDAFGDMATLLAFSKVYNHYLVSKIIENADWELNPAEFGDTVSKLTFTSYDQIYYFSVLVANSTLVALVEPQGLSTLLAAASDITDTPTFVVVLQILVSYRNHNAEGFQAQWGVYHRRLLNAALFLGQEATDALTDISGVS